MSKREWELKSSRHSVSKEEVLQELTSDYYDIQEEMLNRGMQRYGQADSYRAELYVSLLNVPVGSATDEQLWESHVDLLSPSAEIGPVLEFIEFSSPDTILSELTSMLLKNPSKYNSVYPNENIRLILEQAENGQVFYDPQTQLTKRLMVIPRDEALPTPVLKDLILRIAEGFDIGLETTESLLDSTKLYEVALFSDTSGKPCWIFAISEHGKRTPTDL